MRQNPVKQAKISELRDMAGKLTRKLMEEGYREMADENRRIADEFLDIQRDVVLSIDKEIDDIGHIADDIGDDFDEIGDLIPDF